MILCFVQVRLLNERQSNFPFTSSVVILKSGRSSYAGIRLASFDHQKKPQRSFSARTFEVQKYGTKRSGPLMFSEIGKLHAKKIISFTPLGTVSSKCAKS